MVRFNNYSGIPSLSLTISFSDNAHLQEGDPFFALQFLEILFTRFHLVAHVFSPERGNENGAVRSDRVLESFWVGWGYLFFFVFDFF